MQRYVIFLVLLFISSYEYAMHHPIHQYSEDLEEFFHLKSILHFNSVTFDNASMLFTHEAFIDFIQEHEKTCRQTEELQKKLNEFAKGQPAPINSAIWYFTEERSQEVLPTNEQKTHYHQQRADYWYKKAKKAYDLPAAKREELMLQTAEQRRLQYVFHTCNHHGTALD